MTRILIVTGDGSTPDLDYAVFRMREEGFDVTIAAPKKKRLHVVIHQQEEGWDTYVERPWYAMDADASFDEIDPATFDGLLLPGGRAPEQIRNIERCVEIVRHFVDSDKPIGAICRGPLVLLEAGLKGRRLTGNSLIKPRVAIRGSRRKHCDRTGETLLPCMDTGIPVYAERNACLHGDGSASCRSYSYDYRGVYQLRPS
ncbi:MAG: DJ-1/PfpI family protein [Deltaproteobacteria bacterium]|nr:DJ-1/PfpI family protein [Deltaproteobacteria bacterium]